MVKAQALPGNQGAGWVSQAVPYTNLRVWIKGTRADLRSVSGNRARGGRSFQRSFPFHPSLDVAGDPDVTINEDGAIDVYVFVPDTLDPRGVPRV